MLGVSLLALSRPRVCADSRSVTNWPPCSRRARAGRAWLQGVRTVCGIASFPDVSPLLRYSLGRPTRAPDDNRSRPAGGPRLSMKRGYEPDASTTRRDSSDSPHGGNGPASRRPPSERRTRRRDEDKRPDQRASVIWPMPTKLRPPLPHRASPPPLRRCGVGSRPRLACARRTWHAQSHSLDRERCYEVPPRLGSGSGKGPHRSRQRRG